MCCEIMQNRESRCDILLSVTNRKALPTPETPLKHKLHYYQSRRHNSTRSRVFGGEKG